MQYTYRTNKINSRAMHDTHIIIGIATLASLLAIVATLVVIPGLYNEMNELSQRFVKPCKNCTHKCV